MGVPGVISESLFGVLGAPESLKLTKITRHYHHLHHMITIVILLKFI